MTKLTPVPPGDPLMEAVQGVLDYTDAPEIIDALRRADDRLLGLLDKLNLAADRARDAAADTEPITEKDIIRAISPAWLGWDPKDAHRREGFNRRAARYVADLLGGVEGSRHSAEGDDDPVEVTFSGHSDDVVLVESKGAADEFDCYDKTPAATFVLSGTGGSLRVVALYGMKAATWCFAVDMVDEDAPLPPWPIEHRFEGYSAHLTIKCPADVVLVHEAAKVT